MESLYVMHFCHMHSEVSMGLWCCVYLHWFRLMLDQRDRFKQKRMNAEYISEITEDIREGKHQLLYVSPESLICNPLWREVLSSSIYKENLVALAVDEAHCVKHW